MQNQGDKYNWTFHLVLKKQWFDMIAQGIKKEEYRAITPYWTRRLVGDWQNYQYRLPKLRGTYLMPFGVDRICFRNGYQKNARQMVVEWKGLKIDTPNPSWFPEDGDPTEPLFALVLGDIISRNFELPSIVSPINNQQFK